MPTAFGLFFTPWIFDRSLIWAGAITAISVLALFVLFRRGTASPRLLALFGFFYLAFAAAMIFT